MLPWDWILGILWCLLNHQNWPALQSSVMGKKELNSFGLLLKILSSLCVLPAIALTYFPREMWGTLNLHCCVLGWCSSSSGRRQQGESGQGRLQEERELSLHCSDVWAAEGHGALTGIPGGKHIHKHGFSLSGFVYIVSEQELSCDLKCT